MTRVSLGAASNSKCGQHRDQVVPTEEGNGQQRCDTRQGRGIIGIVLSVIRRARDRDNFLKQVATAKEKLGKRVVSAYVSERTDRKQIAGIYIHLTAAIILTFATIFPGMWTDYDHDLGQYPLALGIADNHQCRVIADHLKADPQYYGSRPFLNMTVAHERVVSMVQLYHLMSLLSAFLLMGSAGVLFYCSCFDLVIKSRTTNFFRLLCPALLDLGSVAFIVHLMSDFPDDCPLPQFTTLSYVGGMGVYSLVCLKLCAVALASFCGALQFLCIPTERGLDDCEWYYLWDARRLYGNSTDVTGDEVAEVVVEGGAGQSQS